MKTEQGLAALMEGSKQLGAGMKEYGKQSQLLRGAESIMREDPSNFQGGAEGQKQAAMAYRADDITNAEKMRLEAPKVKTFEHMMMNLLSAGQFEAAKNLMKWHDAWRMPLGGGGGGGGGVPYMKGKLEEGANKSFKADELNFSNFSQATGYDVSPSGYTQLQIVPEEKPGVAMKLGIDKDLKPKGLQGNPYAEAMKQMANDFVIASNEVPPLNEKEYKDRVAAQQRYQKSYDGLKKDAITIVGKMLGSREDAQYLWDYYPDKFRELYDPIDNQMKGAPYEISGNQIKPSSINYSIPADFRSLARVPTPETKKMAKEKAEGKTPGASAPTSGAPSAPAPSGAMDLGDLTPPSRAKNQRGKHKWLPTLSLQFPKTSRKKDAFV